MATLPTQLPVIQLKIKSDGSPEGTTFEDQDGRSLNNVVKFSYNMDVDGLSTVTLVLVGVSVNIDAPCKITTVDELDTLEFPQTTIIKS